MTSEKLLELFGNIDNCYIEEAAPAEKKAGKKWIGVLAAAACIALAIAIPVTINALRTHAPVSEPHVESNPPASTSGQIDVEATAAPTDEAAPLAFLPQYGAFGDEGRTVALSDAQVARLKEREDLAVLADCPTLVNPYPADQGGLLVEVTPEAIAREIAVGQDFLAYYYGAEPSDFLFEQAAGHVVWYKNDEIDGGVNLDWIQFRLTAPYEGEMTAEAIAAQPIVKAALEWKGIHTPEISEEVSLNAKGEAWEYIFRFAAQGSDPVEQLLNFSFRAVTVTVFPAEGLFSISIDYGEPIPRNAETAAVTPEQLDAFLAGAYPDSPPSEYVTEIFYSYNVETGKIIPCYRVYLLEPELPRVAGRVVYSIIEVTTAEIVASADAAEQP